MKPNIHAIISLSAGTLLWAFTRSLYAGVLCFASGFLIDIDHVIEYIIHYGWRDFSLKRFFLICEQTARQEGEHRFKKIYLIFHAGEFSILLWIITVYTKNIYVLAIAIGYSVHLILDMLGNSQHPYSYFILWRAMKDFAPEKLFKKRGK